MARLLSSHSPKIPQRADSPAVAGSGPLGAGDPEAGYFRTWMAGNSNATWGVSRFTITASQITGQFVGVSGAGFSDSYTIHT